MLLLYPSPLENIKLLYRRTNRNSKITPQIEKQIIEKYNCGNTMDKIRKELNIALSTVYVFLLKNNIKIRSKSESLKGKNFGKKHSKQALINISNGHKGQKAWNKNIPCSKEQKEKIRKTIKSYSKITPEIEMEICRLYINKYTIFKISNIFNIAQSSVYLYLLINNVKIRNKSEMYSGKGNPAWNGGTSFLPYCYKFNNKLKDAVRTRDNYTCQLCGKIQGKRKHTVHHIHYDKENCYPDLICLCNSCNSKVNSKRKYYEELFMNKLNDRELLFWIKYN